MLIIKTTHQPPMAKTKNKKNKKRRKTRKTKRRRSKVK